MECKGIMKNQFVKGMGGGIAIGLGYLSVSFGFGIMAAGAGISVFEAFMISLTNLTSAGQAQGVSIIAAGGTLIEMAVVQFIINIRYALMAISLSQKTDKNFTLPKRLIAAYGITDEIFAVCIAKKGEVSAGYMYGVISVSTAGWVLGTFLGAEAGEILPPQITAALGIVLYGMFIAIIIPPSRKEKSVLVVVLMAAALSCVCKYFIPTISGGFAVILCALVSALLAAIFFPKKPEEEEKEEEAE